MKATINHTCGHTTKVDVDSTTKRWVAYFEKHPCFECQPTMVVTRFCGHQEEVKRLFNPSQKDFTAAQDCTNCR